MADRNATAIDVELFRIDAEEPLAIERLAVEGHIRGMMNGISHRTLTGNGAAHVGTLPHVELDGDRAIATNYSLIFCRKDGEPVLLRLNISRIYLSRGPDGWRIDRRIIDPLDGRASSRELAARVFEGPAQDNGAKSDDLSVPVGELCSWVSYGEQMHNAKS